MDTIFLTTEQIETLWHLTQLGVEGGVQIESTADQRSNALLVGVRSRNGHLDNDVALIEPDGATPGWER